MTYKVKLPSTWVDGPKLENAIGKSPGPLRSLEFAVNFEIPAGAALSLRSRSPTIRQIMSALIDCVLSKGSAFFTGVVCCVLYRLLLLPSS
jgi:hypothetical protein